MLKRFLNHENEPGSTTQQRKPAGSTDSLISRREFLKLAWFLGASSGAATFLAACGVPPEGSGEFTPEPLKPISIETATPQGVLNFQIANRMYQILDNDLELVNRLPANVDGRRVMVIPIRAFDFPSSEAITLNPARPLIRLTRDDIAQLNQAIDADTEFQNYPTELAYWKGWIADLHEEFEGEWQDFEQPIVLASSLGASYFGELLWRHVVARFKGDKLACSRKEKSTLDHHVGAICSLLAAFYGMLYAPELAGLTYKIVETSRAEGLVYNLYIFVEKSAFANFLKSLGTSAAEVGLEKLAVTKTGQIVLRYWIPAAQGLMPSFHFVSKPKALEIIAAKFANASAHGWRVISGPEAAFYLKNFKSTWLASMLASKESGTSTEAELVRCGKLENPKKWDVVKSLILSNEEPEVPVVKIPYEGNEGTYGKFGWGTGYTLWMEAYPQGDYARLFVEYHEGTEAGRIETHSIVECTDLTAVGLNP